MTSIPFGLFPHVDQHGRAVCDSLFHNIERIDGMTARVVSFHNPGSGHAFDNAIGVHFAEVGGKERTWAGTNKLRLTVFATCKSTNDYETVRTIFGTIHFR